MSNLNPKFKLFLKSGLILKLARSKCKITYKENLSTSFHTGDSVRYLPVPVPAPAFLVNRLKEKITPLKINYQHKHARLTKLLSLYIFFYFFIIF